ncbi:AI-2E family transporter [Ligilactobacillus sp. WILCCON 0076]|uniref:AI-2E family transporter n=1 Tax=Ligilactobacillus ubinensis TaxID=2876789 RepID=A0A9X2FLR0_9LACO|nr:AI-2E family transporter [Ligilactobacillus ubinensis]MCP0887936.1 AI-2E family transporter [Ligilactobacillus ubinensis]
MFDKKRKAKLMYWSIELLVIATIIFMCTQLDFLFKPIETFISTLFAPIIIAGFLFYLLNPIVKLLMKVRIKKFRIKRTLAVALVFILLIAILGWVSSYMIPKIINQFQGIIERIPNYIKETQNMLTTLSNKKNLPHWLKAINIEQYIGQFEDSATSWVKRFVLSLTTSIGSIIGIITSTAITLITTPFILFYMLKDGDKFMPTIKKVLPAKHADTIEGLLGEMSSTIAKYISGQAIECLAVGTMSVIGYSIIGLPYALIIGVFAGATNIIPYLGPYIGLIPALFIAVPHSFKLVILVIVVCVAVQQIDGNLVYPNVIGKSLEIHPLTIILLLLVAGNLAGLLGMILGVPFYAVAKVVVKYFYDIWKLHFSKSDSKS